MSTDPILVINFGSGYVKLGFACDDAPLLSFPTVIGKLRVNIAVGSSSVEPLTGEAVQTNPDVISCRPIERSVVNRWNEFCSIANPVCQSVDLKSENKNVLIAKPSAIDPKQLKGIREHFI
jgi:actin-related protein